MKKYYTHKEEVAVIIPAFNEAKVIGTTLKAVLKIIMLRGLGDPPAVAMKVAAMFKKVEKD